MKKIKKKVSMIMMMTLMLGMMGVTQANAASTCCDHMSLTTTTTSEFKGATICTQHKSCKSYETAYYKVKKCKNCGAIHSKTYDHSTFEHHSII